MESEKTYEKDVNFFIPIAEAKAKKQAKRKVQKFVLLPGADGRLYKHDFFTEFFHKELNRLCKEAGLCNL